MGKINNNLAKAGFSHNIDLVGHQCDWVKINNIMVTQRFVESVFFIKNGLFQFFVIMDFQIVNQVLGPLVQYFLYKGLSS